MWWLEYVGTILAIPTIMVKLSFRIVGSIFFNVMNMARVDTPVFSAGFEGFDAGYSAYIAMLLHDHDTSHPVVLAFCRHMLLTTCG